MTNAIRQTVRVKDGGVIEVRAPELVPGTLAEVIVLLEGRPAQIDRTEIVHKLDALLKKTQALPEAKAITEEEIAAEIAAYRASRR